MRNPGGKWSHRRNWLLASVVTEARLGKPLQHLARHELRKTAGAKAGEVERDKLESEAGELFDNRGGDIGLAEFRYLVGRHFDTGGVVGMVANAKFAEAASARKLSARSIIERRSGVTFRP